MNIREWLHKQTLRKKWIFSAVGVAACIVIVVFAIRGGKDASRTESYRDARGAAAGLQAIIDYDAGCNEQRCKGTKFNFNVYLLRENGQQAALARPDQQGRVRLALPEGRYIMLIGKQFGGDKLFPQEPVVLKNGKELELKLWYKQ